MIKEEINSRLLQRAEMIAQSEEYEHIVEEIKAKYGSLPVILWEVRLIMRELIDMEKERDDLLENKQLMKETQESQDKEINEKIGLLQQKQLYVNQIKLN
jgi:hypothetical protein